MSDRSKIIFVASFVAIVANISNAYSVSVVSAQTSIPNNFSFQKNLQYGDELYPDVNYLQFLLNQDTRTIVANSGAGSNSELTSFFGDKTLAAVKKFQELYREQILVPAELSEPNGFVGSLTRAQLNKILSEQRTKLISNNSANSSSRTNTSTDSSSNTSQLNSNANTLSGIGTASANLSANYTASSSQTTANSNSTSDSSSGNSSSNYTSSIASIGSSVAVSGVSSALSSNSSGSSAGSSAGTSAMQNFGGKVTKTTMCTCNGSTLLDINDVRGQMLSLLYMPGVSTLYQYYNIYGTGQNVLGTYTFGGQCMVVKGNRCESEGNPRGTIRLIGTSQM